MLAPKSLFNKTANCRPESSFKRHFGTGFFLILRQFSEQFFWNISELLLLNLRLLIVRSIFMYKLQVILFIGNMKKCSPMSDKSNNVFFKGNAQFIFLCNPRKSSLNVYLKKILKILSQKK